MCKIHHDITITNVRDGEAIKHEILLIRGFVTKCCNEEIIKITNKNTTNDEIFSVSKQNGSFKILYNLKSFGRNDFTIKYCNKSVEFHCSYEKSEQQFKLQPLYIVCDGHSGSFNSDSEKCDADEACRRISLGLKLVQCLYAEKLREHNNLERKTFCLRSDCAVFKSKLHVDEARKLPEDRLWDEFAREIINSPLGDDDNLKFVAFISCTMYEPILDNDYSYENIKRHTKAHAALGGGGLALFGSGTLYSWPSQFPDIVSCFTNQKKIDLKRFQDESNYRRTYGGCFASTLGAVCHEIGHVFDLGHTKDGIMGNGFDYVNLVFTNSERTVDLPSRIVENITAPNKDPRLTKVKEPVQFLQKHHEQKAGGDSTFFTKSCAFILNYHKWFNSFAAEHEETHISYDKKKSRLRSDNSYLKVIEIREKENGLVVNYYDFLDEDINVFHLGEIIDLHKYNLFVITSDGSTKLIS